MASSTTGLGISGIGSNLPIDTIISKLMSVESLPLQQLQQQQQSYQNKITAFNQVKGALGAFQGQVLALSMPTNFNSIKTASSDDTIASVSSTKSSADDNSYSINVTQLAQSQRLVTTGGYSSNSSVIGGGTLTFAFGTTSGATFTANPSKASATVTIDPNSSLQDISNAINQAKIGVQASVINDGINGYRLVYSTTDTGANNSLKVTADVPAGPLAAFTHDPAGTTMQQLQPALDAQFKLNGVDIQKSTNSVTDAIDGLSFTLKKAGTATLTVSHDSSGASSAVKAFVKAFNTLNTTLNQVSAYDPSPVDSGQAHAAAVLNGDSAILAIKTQLRQVFNQVPTGLSSTSYRVPADVGLTFDSSGALSLDSAKLQKALTADPEAVAALFGAVGKTTDSQIEYTSSTDKTKIGTYSVDLNGMQHGVLLATPIAAGTYPIDSNTLPTFNVSVDGVALANVSWAAGQTYNSATDVASALQTSINTALAAAPGGSGKGVIVTVDPGTGGLVLQSNAIGTSSSVTVTSGLSGVGFADGSTNTGLASVSGTIGGFSAVGSGATLTGAVGTPVEGLMLTVAGGVTGSRGSVNFTRGFASAMNSLLTNMQATNGIIDSRVKGLNSSATTVSKRITAMNVQLAQTQQRYQDQFNAMDAAVAKLTNLGNYLTQQLASLSSSSSS